MANLRKNFSKIYDQYIDKIYRFVFLKVNSRDIAEDLCSETFLRGWKSFKNKNNTIENPQAFLYKIARNLITDYYRKNGRTQVVPVESVPIPDPRNNLEQEAVLKSDFNNVKIALADLKENEQNIIIWHYLDDLPISEISKMLNKTENTTRVQLHRALKSLKSHLS